MLPRNLSREDKALNRREDLSQPNAPNAPWSQVFFPPVNQVFPFAGNWGLFVRRTRANIFTMHSRFLPLAIVVVPVLLAQRAPRGVDLRNTHHRVLAAVPFVGSGTHADPRRPAYAPLPARGTAASRSGIIAFACQPSDDKALALCEFVAADPAALRPILSDQLVKSFEKGKALKADVETEFRKYKKDFSLDKLMLRVP
jgi:hypothetical protein